MGAVSAHGRRLLNKRQTCMEGLSGQAKSQHGLNHARLRGLVKMHIQSLLTAMVLNLKKLLQVVSGCSAAVCRIVYCVMIAIFRFLLWTLFGLRWRSFLP